MRKPAAPGGLVARSRSAFAHKGKSSALGPSGSVSGGHEVSAPQATEFLSGGQRANILHISLYLVISRYICYISLYPAISGPDIVKYPVQRRVPEAREKRELVLDCEPVTETPSDFVRGCTLQSQIQINQTL